MLWASWTIGRWQVRHHSSLCEAQTQRWCPALERAVYTSKSFIIALALVTKQITVEQAALASTVEVSSQITKWGEVEDCEFNSVLSVILTEATIAHDVDYQDVRRQLASAVCLLSQI